ncbi:hypothetical protein NEICINOT_04818 [Neisseria cinerea ATCC 14685]|uniref:Uncharacterized protein n=1 Tax=Neisseria cinerea ATCC 14685 TaxID=546262 RepID=D0W568_NEICI|nr:hypothetical protein NEICINOT_04818 [Neisseria cinerea ATCC 14685]
MPQYLKSEIYASQTIQASACGFTCAAQLYAGKLSFHRFR